MATWSKGQQWRVVGSLNVLNTQIRAYAPRAVPPATDVNAWGSIADDAHSSTSDHYPHYYSTLGAIAVVCARDFPHAPTLGLDGGVVTEALRQSRDPRIGYLIFNRRITGPNHGWAWQSYSGSDPHDTHFHVSSVHTAVADSTAAWTLPGGTMAGSGITMSWGESLDAYLHRIEDLWVPATAAAKAMPATLAQIGAKLDGANAALTTQGQTISTLVDLLTKAGSPDVAPLVAQLQDVTSQLAVLTERESEQSTVIGQQTALIQQLQGRLAAAAKAEADALGG